MHNITFFFTAKKDDFTKMKYSFYNILYGSSFTTCSYEIIVLCEFTSLYGYINKWRWRAAKLSAYISWHLRLGFTGTCVVCLLTAETKGFTFSLSFNESSFSVQQVLKTSFYLIDWTLVTIYQRKGALFKPLRWEKYLSCQRTN